ncbi:hypothetical protein ACQP1G_00330 [Nocardia sp. CA-107356]|uniref:hypothetical protein n=1 Tax=Nocardia sp. CA-107356 TaxID=3239972 RepID=UPI003D8D5B2A
MAEVGAAPSRGRCSWCLSATPLYGALAVLIGLGGYGARLGGARGADRGGAGGDRAGAGGRGLAAGGIGVFGRSILT